MLSILYLAGGALATIFVAKQQAPVTNGAKTATGVDPVTGRPTSATPAAAGNPLRQTTKAPASAQGARADQGNGANQPWYTGTLIAGGGLALAGVAKALTSAMSSSNTSQSLVQSNSDYTQGEDPDLDADFTAGDDEGDANAGIEADYSYDGLDESDAYSSETEDSEDYSYTGLG